MPKKNLKKTPEVISKAIIEYLSDGTWRIIPIPVTEPKMQSNPNQIELTNLSSSIGQILLTIFLFIKDYDDYAKKPEGLSEEEEKDWEYEQENIGYDSKSGFSEIVNEVAGIYNVSATSVRNKFSKYLKNEKNDDKYIGVEEFRKLLSDYIMGYYQHYDTRITDLERTLYNSLLPQNAKSDRAAIDKFFRNPRETTFTFQDHEIENN